MRFERPTAATFASRAAEGAFYNKFLKALEGAIDDIAQQVADLTQIVLDIQAAQAAADAADTKARARMDDLPEVVFTADYTGTLASDQLPQDIAVKRYDGTTNVSASSTWTRTVESGDVTCTIGAATGVLNITAIGSDSVVRIESTKDGLTLRKKQVLTIAVSAPPNTGSTGGSTSWSDTTFDAIASNVMSPITDELVVTVGASGEVDLSAPLTVGTSRNAPDGTFKVWGIWQWWDGSAWSDLGTEVSSSPDCVVTLNPDTGIYTLDIGYLRVNSSKTGLTPAATEKFRFMARNDSGSRAMNFAGTASAVS